LISIKRPNENVEHKAAEERTRNEDMEEQRHGQRRKRREKDNGKA